MSVFSVTLTIGTRCGRCCQDCTLGVVSFLPLPFPSDVLPVCVVFCPNSRDWTEHKASVFMEQTDEKITTYIPFSPAKKGGEAQAALAGVCAWLCVFCIERAEHHTVCRHRAALKFGMAGR